MTIVIGHKDENGAYMAADTYAASQYTKCYLEPWESKIWRAGDTLFGYAGQFSTLGFLRMIKYEELLKSHPPYNVQDATRLVLSICQVLARDYRCEYKSDGSATMGLNGSLILANTSGVYRFYGDLAHRYSRTYLPVGCGEDYAQGFLDRSFLDERSRSAPEQVLKMCIRRTSEYVEGCGVSEGGPHFLQVNVSS